MALLGTEAAIICPKCGSVEFEEKVVVRFHEALTLEKLKRDISIGAKGNAMRRTHSYFCTKCGEQIA